MSHRAQILDRRRPGGAGWLALGALLGCSSPVSGVADGGPDGGGDGGCDGCAADGGPREGVRCGPMECPPAQLCMITPAGVPSCILRGDEPVHPPPLNYIFLYCDEDGDCAPGRRCVASRGEWTRVQCTLETPETAPDCFVHANHLCGRDDDCHVCRTGGNPPVRFNCRPFREPGLGALKSCQPQ